MAQTTWYQRSTTIAIGGVVGAHECNLAAATGTAAELAITLNSLATNAYYFVSPSGSPGVGTWPSGTAGMYEAQINITTGASDLQHLIGFQRINSGLTTLQNPTNYTMAEAAFTGTGLRVATSRAIYNPNAASTTSTDRFLLEDLVTNNNMMSAQTMRITVNTTDSYVIWDKATSTEYTDSATVYLDLVADGTDEYTGGGPAPSIPRVTMPPMLPA